jgi:HlyD family secretion protein
VETVAAAPATVEEIVSTVSAGTVKARRESVLSAEAGGRFTEVLVSEGDRVRKGQLLARGVDEEVVRQAEAADFDATQATEALKAARARRDEAKDRWASDAARAEANLAQAEEDHRRAASLAGSGLVTRAELDAASTKLLNAREDVRLAALGSGQLRTLEREVASREAAARSAAARARGARDRAAKLSVSAPFDGIVVRKSVMPGEAKLPGAPLFTVADPSDLYVYAEVDEAESARVHAGQEARLLPEAYRGETFRGKVLSVRPLVEASKDVARATVVELAFLPPHKPLRIGMSVDAEVVTGRKEARVAVPSSSIMERETEKFVYVVSGGKAVRRNVATGVSNWERTEILSGLSPGDPVVTTLDVKGLAEGSPVVVRKRR